MGRTHLGRNLALFVLLAACGASTNGGAATSATSKPARPDTWLSILALASPGSTIQLVAGTYRGAVVRGLKFSPAVTITGVPGDRPRFTDLTLDNVQGLTFKGMEFDASGTPVGKWGAEATIGFIVASSRDIHFDHDDFHGDRNGTLLTTVSGLIVRSSNGVSVSDSEFSHLHNAFEHLDDLHLTLTGNSFHDLWDDAIRGGGSSWVTIDSNHCWSNHPDIADTDHPDCIQFWTSGTKNPAHDISVTNNRYEIGSGTPTQFIFFGNELSIPYEGITVSGNVGFGSAWNGITIQGARNVTISDNVLTSSCKIWAEPIGRPQAMISRLTVSRVDGLVLRKNAVGDFRTRGGNTNVTQSGETATSCRSRP